MKMGLLHSLTAGFASALFCGLTVAAQEQDFPTKRINIVVGFEAGGFADTVSRLVADHMGQKLKQTVIVTNRAGGGSNIAARAVATSPPDGYTLLGSTTALTVNATLYKKIDYNVVEDLIPVAVVVRAPEQFAVHPDRPRSMQEFLDAAKKRRMTFSSAGVGSGSHLTWFAFFKNNAKVDVNHVPFKGGSPAMQAALGGQVDGIAATASGNQVAQVASGALVCLGVAAAKRYNGLPNCPTLAELGYPGVEASSWVGFWVPKGTPPQIVAKLNEAINSIAENKDAAEKLSRNGEISTFSPKEVADFVRKEVGAWGERVKASGAEVN